MWRLNKLLFILFALWAVNGVSQDCSLVLSGKVHDESTGNAIPFASIFVQEIDSGAVSDSLGNFQISGLCPGDLHLRISHIGCETKELYVNLSSDSLVSIELDHHSHSLGEVSVIGEGKGSEVEESTSLSKDDISENANKDLAAMIDDIAGVSMIQNGSGISKPVVHGLSGNRLMILNNGIAQSGQQWGVDHSPEIDPLVANKITVIKGVGALEYQGNNLGSVVLVEPESIRKDPHLHGGVRSFYQTNGNGFGLNADLQQAYKSWAWRAVGTYRKSGDTHSPDYFLTNTGTESANYALQLEKSFGSRWRADVYFSSYNTELGVLRGSHIGNLTDLEGALERDEPLFTEDSFSYEINPPRQEVNHNLLKAHLAHDISADQTIDLTYSFQYNLRNEYDVRRGGRSGTPSLSLEQFTHTYEGKYKHYMAHNWVLNTGAQLTWVENDNLPGTGVSPLIPDYDSQEYGLFAILSKKYDLTTFELGGRFDFEERQVRAVSTTLPRETLLYDTDYQNYGAMLGINHQLAEKWTLIYNLGYANRNPEVNELYSNGLHQGVAGIEEGDPNLKKEESIKTSLSLKGRTGERLSLEVLGYFQNIKDYIFLNPTGEYRLTIRGAFPVFRYEQTNAQIAGFDLVANYMLTPDLRLTGKYSFLRGTDMSNNQPLINMPANNLLAVLTYRLGEWKGLENIELELNNKYVFEQTNYNEGQDFVAPPPAYNLLGAKVSGTKHFGKTELNINFRFENILNTEYRDYLNRLRYFADDLGFNFLVGANLKF